MHLDGRTFAAGSLFHFDFNLFETQSPAVFDLAMTFSQLAREGLGPDRRKVELLSVAQLNERGEISHVIYESGSVIAQRKIEPLAFDLHRPQEQVSRLQIQFLTPTELKNGQQIATRPDFGVLAARVRDRISTLRELYGGGALKIDFHGFGQRAAHIKMTHCEIVKVDVQRRSSRTGQVHSIGGFTGQAEYQGDLTEFVPFLNLAQWTGVGRQTVWGKGAIAVLQVGRNERSKRTDSGSSITS